MKDVLKRVEKEEDKRKLQGSTLDLGYETSYHNSALDLHDETDDTGQNGKPGAKNTDLNGNAKLPHYFESAADFETAISSTGFGKFQYILLIAIVPASMSAIFGTSSMSFILPAATCEFELTSFKKGLLNGAIYSGMISSGFFWGFVSDVMGRQKPLFLGLLADGIASFCLSCSQSFEYLIVFKFLAGLAICGPFSLTYAYLSEFFDKSRRDSIVMMTGCFTSFGSLLQPVIAYFIIPNNWEFILFDTFLINSWRIFLMLSTLPSLTGAFLVYFMPETPKFLMTHGRTEEAMRVFQTMYAWNTGHARESYPVKRLQSGMTLSGEKKGFVQSVAEGWEQVNPLFKKPYLTPALIIFLMQALTMLSLNTVRLLQPQIFASYLAQNGAGDIDVCTTIDSPPSNKTSVLLRGTHLLASHCATQIIDSRVYSNATFVGACTFGYFIIANFLMPLLGKKKLYVISILLCAVVIGVYPWSYSFYVVILACFFMAVMSTTCTLVVSCSVQQFPTTLRALAVNMTMISGRVGVLFGSLLFSVFIERACQMSFLALAVVNIVCALVMTFCLTERTAEDDDLIPKNKMVDSLDKMAAISIEQLTAEDLREVKMENTAVRISSEDKQRQIADSMIRSAAVSEVPSVTFDKVGEDQESRV